MTTPKNAKLSRELDTAHGYVENSWNKKSYITYQPSKQMHLIYIYIYMSVFCYVLIFHSQHFVMDSHHI
jgi:hypothetical protein